MNEEKQWRVLVHVTSAAYIEVEAKSEREAMLAAVDEICDLPNDAWENVSHDSVEAWEIADEADGEG
jgi:hypothetical protein